MLLQLVCKIINRVACECSVQNKGVSVVCVESFDMRSFLVLYATKI